MFFFFGGGRGGMALNIDFLFLTWYCFYPDHEMYLVPGSILSCFALQNLKTNRDSNFSVYNSILLAWHKNLKFFSRYDEILGIDHQIIGISDSH